MSYDDFMTWSARYCAIFQQDITRPSTVAMLAEWREEFDSEQFSYAEINDSLSAMRKNPPETRWDHLRFLLLRVRKTRVDLAKAAREERERRASEADRPMTGAEWKARLSAFRRIMAGGVGIPVTEAFADERKPQRKEVK